MLPWSLLTHSPARGALPMAHRVPVIYPSPTLAYSSSKRRRGGELLTTAFSPMGLAEALQSPEPLPTPEGGRFAGWMCEQQQAILIIVSVDFSGQKNTRRRGATVDAILISGGHRGEPGQFAGAGAPTNALESLGLVTKPFDKLRLDDFNIDGGVQRCVSDDDQ